MPWNRCKIFGKGMFVLQYIYFLKVLTFCLVLRRGAGSMYCDVDGGPGAVATGPVAEDGIDLNISETVH